MKPTLLCLALISPLFAACAPPCQDWQCAAQRQQNATALLGGLAVLEAARAERQQQAYIAPDPQPFVWQSRPAPLPEAFQMRRADPVPPAPIPQWPYGKGWLLNPNAGN